MREISCPRCGSSEIREIADGYYKCDSCGYTGSLDMDKSISRE
ncbi:TPA: hypothetical protein HA239_02810 [Candidatus Woesearchaeota archaeon]|nr:hypothetical protein QT06_C0001G0702 [archaeon GW2011_AR15]MBS3103511.1 transposase [Candidatus Woesearchaeota archaeon]HIH41320.1 hypothetical protein [Candidatus Woesearchaeota archaeon]